MIIKLKPTINLGEFSQGEKGDIVKASPVGVPLILNAKRVSDNNYLAKMAQQVQGNEEADGYIQGEVVDEVGTQLRAVQFYIIL